MRVEYVTDLAPSPVWLINDRDGFLHSRAAITWTGGRIYHFADGPKRVLRRWSQVGSPGHLATLTRLTATPGHPMVRGRPVNITRDNARKFGVGFAGGNLVHETINGFDVPVGDVTIDTPSAISKIQAGATQTSLGYVALIDTTGGVWDGPGGAMPFDFEHVLDPVDPRVLALVEETKNDEHPFEAATLGGNHFAVALDRGRGAELSELVSPLDSLHTHQPPPNAQRACRVFMYRDAAGIETPIQDEDNSMPTKLIQVPLVIDGLQLLARRTVDLDEETSVQLAAFLTEASVKMGEWAAKLSEAEAGLEEATVKVEAAEGAQATMATETEEMRDSLKKATERIKTLEAEVNDAPRLVEELMVLRGQAKRIHDAEGVDYDKLNTAAEVKAKAVQGKTGEHAKAPVVVIDALWDTFLKQLKDAKSKPRAKTNEPRRRFKVEPRDGAPEPKPSRGRNALNRINAN